MGMNLLALSRPSKFKPDGCSEVRAVLVQSYAVVLAPDLSHLARSTAKELLAASNTKLHHAVLA